ncbi:hypothetical protein IC619_011160 [Hazenella sp. IB182353]|uniref:DUF7408 domain-containing protein n=1 Tax=Polycladospora coralii TaxID=2771432 RepID=UPI0017471F54|nr:hypothetical protein [Polycladospora coralii]MBS7531052.1 hypothetical protein [Polycladospora coralii]
MGVFLSLLVLSGVLPNQVWADETIDMRVEVGWNGEGRGDLIPVQVTLSSESRALNGELTVNTDFSKLQVMKMAVPVEEVNIPTGTEKKVTLLVPSELFIGLSRIVFTEQDQVVASAKMNLKRFAQSDTVMGYLTDQPNDANQLLEMMGESQDPSMRMVPLQVADIPIQGRAFSGFDVLFINGLTKESLTETQARAIQMWVANGGTLVVGGSGVQTGTKHLEGLLPVEKVGHNEIEVKDTGVLGIPSLRVIDARLRAGEKDAITSGNQVIMASKKWDSGQVVFTGFDLVSAELKDWSGYKALWKPYLSRENRNEMYNGPSIGIKLFKQDPYLLSGELGKFPHVKLPNLLYLGIAFILYVVLVGPIFYWILRRKRLQKWNWVAMPALALVMAIGVFIYGHALRGNQPYIHQLGFIQSDKQGNATVHQMFAFLPEQAGDYQLQVKEGFMWPQHGVNFFPGGSQDKRHPVQFNQGTKLSYPKLPQLDVNYGFSESLAQIGGELTGTVYYDKKKWRIEVENGTQIPLYQVTVLAGNKTFDIGALNPAEKKNFELPDNVNLSAAMDPYAYHSAQSIEKSLINTTSMNDLSEKDGNIDIVGFTKQNMVPIQLENKDFQSAHTYLLAGNTKMAGDENGNVALPAGYVSPTVFESAHPYYDRMPGQKEITMEGSGDVTFQYDFSAYVDTVSDLTFSAYQGEITVWNWQTQKWDALAQLKKENMKSYLSFEQKLLVRSDQIPANTPINIPQVEVKGSVHRDSN